MAVTDRGEARARLGQALAGVLPADRIAADVPMRLHTSFRIGGPADFLVTVAAAAELTAVLGCCRRLDAPFLVLGRGTNLLVRDGGVRGVVIRLAGEFADVSVDREKVVSGAAVGLGDLAGECGRQGLTGLEFAVGIPGTVGGAIIMNAGAYESEMKDVTEAATVIRPEDLVTETRPASTLEFGYRASRPQREGWIVISARLGLRKGDPAAIREREADFTARRRNRQPSDLPSAGSVFKRPEGHFAGPLIDRAGCRGLRVGDAQVSELHAGFIVNLGAATARDVLTLIDAVGKAVEASAGVRLEPEIRIVGEDSGRRPGGR